MPSATAPARLQPLSRHSSTDRSRPNGFGLYVHWPFCEAKCPYCDFNSHVVRRVDHAAWQRAFLAELDRIAADFPDRHLDTIFFGGGTPSLMPPALVGAVVDRACTVWTPATNMEITLEANPTSSEAQKFAGYRTAGVNRVSLGVQALNDADLKRLGRLHSAREALDAVAMARHTFDRVSFDLIAARQHQTPASWQRELSVALALGPDHLSLYQLTVEDGTAFGDRFHAGTLRGLPDEDAAADMFDLTIETCAAAGLLQYEVSNFARPGQESRHNLIYWRYGDYAGIGPGAHGRLRDAQGQLWATETVLAPGKWLADRESGTHETRVALTETEQANEMMLMGLRLVEGVSRKRYRQLSGQDLDSAHVARLVDLGALDIDGDRLAVTKSYRGVLNTVLAELLAD